jgi:hypothetical protein
VKKGYYSITSLLIRFGANINALDNVCPIGEGCRGEKWKRKKGEKPAERMQCWKLQFTLQNGLKPMHICIQRKTKNFELFMLLFLCSGDGEPENVLLPSLFSILSY